MVRGCRRFWSAGDPPARRVRHHRKLGAPTAGLRHRRIQVHHLRPANLGPLATHRRIRAARVPGPTTCTAWSSIWAWNGSTSWERPAGGIPAIDYALSHPDRVRSLVASNTIAGVQDPEYMEVQERIRPPEIQNLPVELRELGASYRGADPEGAARWLEIDHSTRPYGVFPRQPLREPITYSRLSTMRVPTLVLSGNADLMAPPALMRLQAAAIPTSRYASLPDAGHNGFWERPEAWNGLVLEFIGQH